MTSLLLLDDHALIRRGMRDALQDEGFTVRGEAGSWDELSPLLDRDADVLLLDLQLPGVSGLQVIDRLSGRAGAPAIVVVSMYPQDQYADRVLRAGAHAYVPKSADTATLVKAVHSVAESRSQRAASAKPPQRAPHENLPDVEQALLVQLARGLKLADAAQHVGLAPKAASIHRARILQKLRLAGNADLAHYAAQHGLIAH